MIRGEPSRDPSSITSSRAGGSVWPKIDCRHCSMNGA
jgi:hypothetical protein